MADNEGVALELGMKLLCRFCTDASSAPSLSANSCASL